MDKVKRTPYRLIMDKKSETTVEDFPNIMESINKIRYVYLSSAEYSKQLAKPDARWLHPKTGEICMFDDWWYETWYETLTK